MNKLHRFLILGACLGFSALLPAQTTDDTRRGPRGHGPGGPHGHGPGGPGRGPARHIIRALDSDRDRELSSTEIANAPASLRALDTNADGNVNRDDLRPARPADAPTPPTNRPQPPAGKRRGPLNPIMLALDADENGELSTAEINNATVSLGALDANQDGKLTFDEFVPEPPEGARFHHGKRRQGPPSSDDNG